MNRPATPPPRLRPTVTPQERVAIELVIGPVPDDELLRAVRDGRGRAFQRLELLGDSVLDLVLAVHAVVEPGCVTCLRTGHPGEPARLVTDRRLARQARERGLGSWLEWEASDDRLADLVETSVAVAWRARGWAGACDVVAAVVHPLGSEVVHALRGGGTDAVGQAATARRLGASVLELAAAWWVFRALPDADEGELSAARARIHRATRIAEQVVGSGVVDAVGDPGTVTNRVERWLAETLLRDGADRALADAEAVLR